MDKNIEKVIPEYFQFAYFPIYCERQQKNGSVKNISETNAFLKIIQMLNIRTLDDGVGIIIKKR
jgi:hypothetical protein